MPFWSTLKLAKIAANPIGLWSLALEYVSGSQLLRFTVSSLDDQQRPAPTVWSPISGTDCGADGIRNTPPKSGFLSTSAAYGALIGKIGGSSADLPDSSSGAAPYGNKRVFAVGSYCLISIGATEGGPLFLTMNDSPEAFAHHSGALYVLVEQHSV
jgi:hypothetical protein